MGRQPARGAYGLSEFAKLAGMSPTTVADRMDSGEIPELRRIGARRFIPARWVDRWLSEIVNEREAAAS